MQYEIQKENMQLLPGPQQSTSSRLHRSFFRIRRELKVFIGMYGSSDEYDKLDDKDCKMLTSLGWLC
jgi:hypothetical protein